MAGNARTVGDRIEELLASLQSGRDKETAEQLVRLLIEMYGDGLSRVVSMLDAEQVARLAEDDLVESLLLLHDLHPLDVNARVERALDRVRPYLGSHAGGVQYLGVDDGGVAHLRLEGSCEGCASSTLTVKMAIEGAIQDAAPELTGIEVAGVAEPAAPLLQVGKAPPPGWAVGEPEPAVQPAAAGASWVTLPDIGPPTGRPTTVELRGERVLVCSVRGTLYAYRDSCAGCGSSLAEAGLNGNMLTCSACGARFNVRLAGRGLDRTTSHLDPLPLLSDSNGVRVAVPQAVP
ncbi:MAG TPA: NifU family protein [Streptosporangiaceae bacterium]|jgi:Fe-S cluster biogenesis protein NfuA/nitrite reductase/ring-hydroxylating ferredoxin subunit